MNAHALARNGYALNASSARTDRDTEYRIIAKISHRMKAAAEAGPAEFPRLLEALNDNRRLWDALAIDVAHPDNRLPQALRAQIFYLAQFVNLHTAKAISGTAKVGPLLEINAAILKGLGGNRGAK